MQFDTPIDQVPMVGPRYRWLLSKLNITTVGDLLLHVPHRYQDFALFSPISKAQRGATLTIQGQIVSIQNIYTRTGKKIQKAAVSDGEDKIEVTWFNQPFLVKTLPPGTFVTLSGKVDVFGSRKTLVSPQYEKINSTYDKGQGGTIHTGRLVPIYSETLGLSSKWLRSRIAAVLPDLEIIDMFPVPLRKKYSLYALKDAVNNIHFPRDFQEAERARERLAFDELFELQLETFLRRKKWHSEKKGIPLKIRREWVLGFVKNLPFRLTSSQEKAAREILESLTKDTPMNRLLEGDVGSGKTVVAALACFIAFKNGYQSAIMAPTQILALQHYKTLKELLGPHGVNIQLLTASKKLTADSYELPADILVGTHSLIQKRVNFPNLGLIVIDEQHRFGVKQRAILAKKSKSEIPHVLTMTATPIPRTVAMAAYGDLDLSTLDELPKGRVKIKTWVVPPKKRDAAYSWIRERVANTSEQAHLREQAFIVCPLIEESQKETMQSVKAAAGEFERLRKKVFPDIRLALLHGKIRSEEKEKIMDKMKRGEIDILVATPVVEVGIDIPNATIMMVETAERFGLAQLHQLRGRVGRADKQSYCLLFAENRSPRVLQRLHAMEQGYSGHALAQIDLEMRGPGQVFGTAQHGFPELKIASFSDFDLIKKARNAAEEVVENIDKYPKMKVLLKRQRESFEY